MMKNAATIRERKPRAISRLLQNGFSSSGVIWQKRIIPRNEQFRSDPESRAEIVPGASLCAAGYQVWKGARPIFVP